MEEKEGSGDENGGGKGRNKRRGTKGEVEKKKNKVEEQKE